ncbi:MAG TPA: efflux RND transporter periplasmic adaptor subunit, partial [Gemmataceae bacterium]|nr:efflux RND transporter periplasmic adaptor subunit [Gemmataceae bacterium]
VVIGEWTELPGATQPLPNRAARITAAVEGRVEWLLQDPAAKNGKPITEGARIEKGQVIGKLDDRLVRASLEKLQTALAEAKEQNNQSEIAVKLAQIEVNSLAELRGNAMNGSGRPPVSQIQLDKARLTLETAESKHREIEAKLKGIEDEIVAEKDHLDLFVLRAPITGRLGPIQAVPGQTLALGAVVAEIVDLDAIDVLTLVPPPTAARLALGQPARVVGDKETTPSAATPGKIEFIAVQAQPETGFFAVKVRFPNSDGQLRSGSLVRIAVLTKPRQPRITIPESALLEDQDPPGVVIVRDLHPEINPETKKEEQIGIARRLRAIIGVRDRLWKKVEIIRLEDPETKEQVPLDDQVQFVVKGGQGLEGDSKEGDKVKQEVDED